MKIIKEYIDRFDLIIQPEYLDKDFLIEILDIMVDRRGNGSYYDMKSNEISLFIFLPLIRKKPFIFISNKSSERDAIIDVMVQWLEEYHSKYHTDWFAV